jgi:hypothetical protein
MGEVNGLALLMCARQVDAKIAGVRADATYHVRF